MSRNKSRNILSKKKAENVEVNKGKTLLRLLDREASIMVWDALKRGDVDTVYHVMNRRQAIRQGLREKYEVNLDE